MVKAKMETPRHHHRTRLALQSCIRIPVESDEDEELRRRRRALSRTQLVKRLRISLHDWHRKRSRLDRRTNASTSTIALLKKVRYQQQRDSSDEQQKTVDPITRERISPHTNHSFTFRRGSAATSIDASALIDYILNTGDYSDPESRIPFDDCALSKLDEIGKRLGKPSVLKARAALEAKFSERQFLRDALCGLERVCGDSITQMFETVERVNEQEQCMEEAHVILLTYVIPEFQSSFGQLVAADSDYARQSAMQFEAFLRGPPNKPMKSTPIQVLVMELFRTSVNEALKE